MSNQVTRYFDLHSEIRSSIAADAGSPPGSPKLSAWQQWVALLAGILVQPYLAQYRTAGEWTFVLAEFWGWLLFAVIVAVIIFPGVYKQAFDPKKAAFLQAIPIFTAGLGWEALFATAVEAIK